MSYTPSIFEAVLKSNQANLWEKPQAHLRNSPISFQISSWKKSLSPGEFDMRNFYITKNYLYYKKSQSSKIKTMIDLKWSRIKFFQIDEEHPEFNNEKYYFLKYGLSISRNGKYSEIFIRSAEELELWKEALRPYCIMADFHENYKVEKLIGEGVSAKVNISRKFKLTLNRFSKSLKLLTKILRGLLSRRLSRAVL